eukprot:8740457-Prorocentrum_lima.AAC.1
MLEPNNPWSVHQSLCPDTRPRSANFVGMISMGDPSMGWGHVDQQPSPSTAIVPSRNPPSP